MKRRRTAGSEDGLAVPFLGMIAYSLRLLTENVAQAGVIEVDVGTDVVVLPGCVVRGFVKAVRQHPSALEEVLAEAFPPELHEVMRFLYNELITETLSS